ncbi:hypothetical protein BGZ83_002782 [Gryganskiella cystojenkinii]|nr:hypothetical protein BGZ83_002782 [Gryganskiella cystojenkinii]
MDSPERQTAIPQSLTSASLAPEPAVVNGENGVASNHAKVANATMSKPKAVDDKREQEEDQLSSPAPSSSTATHNDNNVTKPRTGSQPPTNGDASTKESQTSKASSEQQQQQQQQPKKKKVKQPVPLPAHLPGPLTRLPNTTTLPELEDFNLLPEQMKNPLFVAISKILIVYGNAWQSANDLVDGIRHFNLANLGGRTPKGTVQGAISTGLALAAALGTFEPIEKNRTNGTTYYRMAAQALEPPSSEEDSDATRLPLSHTTTATITITTTTNTGNPRPRVKATPVIPNARRKLKPTTASGSSNNGDASAKSKKRRTVTAYNSDTLSSDSSDDDASPNSSKRVRTGTPTKPVRPELMIPNGLKKLPKGYVYDTDVHQASLKNLLVDSEQTGEFMEQLKEFNAALEIEYPDRRGDFGVDLEQEPAMFAVYQQVGYTYPRLRTSGRERLPKTVCEDGYCVADLKHNGGYLGRLFCITDGHGGEACSSFVIATIPGAMQVILGKYRPEDLSLPHVQERVKDQITEAVRLIDKEYLDYKKQQYLLYKAKKIQTDPGSDGTTLIVNIFIGQWIICVNVGDSRSILSSRDRTGRWNVNFYSEDHTPSLERLAQSIYKNGGEFVTHDDKLIKFDPTLKNDKKHRQSLKEARIRVKDAALNVYGIPYRTRNGQCASINLGACIGDVLYKLDPVNPVLSYKPDITFIDTSKIGTGYLLMASDGLWDYVLRGGKVQDQNAAVCQYVGDKLDRGWNHQRIVAYLSDRESETSLYSDSIQEYDDFTAILVSINNRQLPSDIPEEELIRQEESARLQDAVMARREKLMNQEQDRDDDGDDEDEQVGEKRLLSAPPEDLPIETALSVLSTEPVPELPKPLKEQEKEAENVSLQVDLKEKSSSEATVAAKVEETSPSLETAVSTPPKVITGVTSTTATATAVEIVGDHVTSPVDAPKPMDVDDSSYGASIDKSQKEEEESLASSSETVF